MDTLRALMATVAQCSKMLQPCSAALDLTGSDRLQALRPLHESVRPGRTLPSFLPSIHSLQFLGTQYHFEFWMLMPNPYWITRP